MADLKISMMGLSPSTEIADTDYLHIRTATQDRRITWADILKSHESRIDNPHQVTKEQVGLGQVDNVPVLNKNSNFSDVPNKEQARNNLGVPSIAQLSLAIPTGVILMWAGAIDDIPEGFALCDGTNGTPNLVSKFTVGAGGSYVVGATGGSSNNTHNHAISVSSHKLAWDEIPPHKHNSGWGENGNGYFGSDPAYGGGRSGSGSTDRDNKLYLTREYIVNPANASQQISDNKAHSHTASSGSITTDNRPPFYALAYIIKT